MINRTSIVKTIHVNFVSAIFEIGDSQTIKPRTKALAVQRQYELFFGDEGNFNKYPIFTKPIPKPIMDEPITFTRYNKSSAIHVNNIDITSVAASGVIHIGSTKTIDAEARIKNIRQLLGESDTQD